MTQDRPNPDDLVYDGEAEAGGITRADFLAARDILAGRVPADRIRGLRADHVIIDDEMDDGLTPQQREDILRAFTDPDLGEAHDEPEFRQEYQNEPPDIPTIQHVRLHDCNIGDLMLTGLHMELNHERNRGEIHADRLVGPTASVNTFCEGHHEALCIGGWTLSNIRIRSTGSRITSGDMTVVDDVTMLSLPSDVMHDLAAWGRDTIDEETRAELMQNGFAGVDPVAVDGDETVLAWAALPRAGVPNRNGDVFTAEAIENARPQFMDISHVNRPADRIAGQANPGAEQDVYRQSDESDLRALNEALFDQLTDIDAEANQEAVDAINDFTRTRMREEGFYRRIMPPIGVSNDELDRQVDSLAGHVMSQAEDWATPDERAEWAIWIPKRRCYLAILNNTVTWGNTVPKLKFPDRLSATQFRPDLQKAHNAEVVQVTNMWYEIVATLAYEEINRDGEGRLRRFTNNRIYTFDQSTSFWADPERTDEHRAMRFSDDASARAVLEMIKELPARGLHRSKPGILEDVGIIPCHTTKYRLPQPEVEVQSDYHKPLRAIQLRDD